LNPRIESDLEKALRSLRNQGISVNEENIPPDGRVFFLSPMEIALTGHQILKLKEDGKLDSQGIKNFALKEGELLERDVEAAVRRVAPEELRTWTAAKVCEFINLEFCRVHSVRPLTDALNRLNIQYKRV
jgi:hypothetical protein